MESTLIYDSFKIRFSKQVQRVTKLRTTRKNSNQRDTENQNVFAKAHHYHATIAESCWNQANLHMLLIAEDFVLDTGFQMYLNVILL